MYIGLAERQHAYMHCGKAHGAASGLNGIDEVDIPTAYEPAAMGMAKL